MGKESVQASQKETPASAQEKKNTAQARTLARSVSYDSPQGVSLARLGSAADIPITRTNLLFLQRTVGNRAVTQLLQRKAKLSQPGDADEREADQVAEQVMRGPEELSLAQADSLSPPSNGMQIHRSTSAFGAELNRPLLREEEPRKRPEEETAVQLQPIDSVMGIQPQAMSAEEEKRKRPEEETLQAKEPDAQPTTITPQAESQINGLQNGGGEPLPESVRAYFEPRFGQDFSDIRVHTGSQAAESAQAINARAYTTGRTVAFGAGEYAPETTEGKKLLAHELTHVVQQKGGTPSNLQPLIQRQPDPAPANPAAGDANDAAAKIQRILATKDAKAIHELTDQELSKSTAAQRAGMARIITDLTWTNESEERDTLRVIRFGGQDQQVISFLDAVGYRQKLIDSIDNAELNKELMGVLAAVPQSGQSGDPAIVAALTSRKPKDIIAITDFSKASNAQRLSQLEILLSMGSSNADEEKKILDILESSGGGLAGLVDNIKSLGLKQALFDHIDEASNKQRLTNLLGNLKDPALDQDLEVFNRSFWGNLAEGFKGGLKSAWENFSLGKIISGILKPIIHPIDTIVDLVNQFADFLKRPSWGGFLAFMRDLTGTIAVWLLVLTGIVALIDAALAAGIITLPAAIPVTAIGAALGSWAGYMGIAFLVFAGLKFLLDVVEAGASTTAPELEQKKEAIGQDITLAVLIGLTAGIFKLLKVTIARFRGAATDPAKADPDALKDAANESEKNKSEADQQAKDMQSKADEANKQTTQSPKSTADWKPGDLLPNAEQAQIDPAKFEKYSMDPNNSGNGGKWKAFREAGYDVESDAGRASGAQDVMNQLRQGLLKDPATQGKVSTFGPRFEVRTEIKGPNGKTGTLVTIWQFDAGATAPRMITNWFEVH